MYVVSEDSRFSPNSTKYKKSFSNKAAAEKLINNYKGDAELWPDLATRITDCNADLDTKNPVQVGVFYTILGFVFIYPYSHHAVGPVFFWCYFPGGETKSTLK